MLFDAVLCCLVKTGIMFQKFWNIRGINGINQRFTEYYLLINDLDELARNCMRRNAIRGLVSLPFCIHLYTVSR